MLCQIWQRNATLTDSAGHVVFSIATKLLGRNKIIEIPSGNSWPWPQDVKFG